MKIIAIIFVSIAILLLFKLIVRTNHLSARKNSKKLKATVIEYRKERIKAIRNDFTKIEYPYVKIKEDNNTKLICLRNASSSKRYYQIGEEVEVFWHDEKLLAWEL